MYIHCIKITRRHNVHPVLNTQIVQHSLHFLVTLIRLSLVLIKDGVQTVGRKTSWAKDVWANYFLGDRRLGDNSYFKKDVSPKDGWATRPPKQFASQCSTLVRNIVVRATIKVNGKPPIWVAIAP